MITALQIIGILLLFGALLFVGEYILMGLMVALFWPILLPLWVKEHRYRWKTLECLGESGYDIKYMARGKDWWGLGGPIEAKFSPQISRERVSVYYEIGANMTGLQKARLWDFYSKNRKNAVQSSREARAYQKLEVEVYQWLGVEDNSGVLN